VTAAVKAAVTNPNVPTIAYISPDAFEELCPTCFLPLKNGRNIGGRRRALTPRTG
jgi:hypothetical protein